MSDFLYNDESINSIVEYAQHLENKSIDDVNLLQNTFKGKS